MIPTPEQLQQVSQLRSGTMTEVPFGALLLALSVERRTLVLEVRRKQMSKRIMLENGVPIDCRSNLVHETLGRFMVGLGKLGAEDLHSYLSQSAANGMPLGEVLLDHGVVTAEELYKLLQQNLAKKLLDIFSWRDGEFRVHDETPRPESSLKVRVPQLIVTGITKFAQQEEVDAGVVPLVGKKLCLNPDPPYALEEIRLSQRQGQVAVALRSGWRIDELALGTGMPFEELTRLLYALSVLGVVITEDHPAARAALRAARLTNPTVAAAPPPQPPPLPAVPPLAPQDAAGRPDAPAAAAGPSGAAAATPRSGAADSANATDAAHQAYQALPSGTAPDGAGPQGAPRAVVEAAGRQQETPAGSAARDTADAAAPAARADSARFATASTPAAPPAAWAAPAAQAGGLPAEPAARGPGGAPDAGSATQPAADGPAAVPAAATPSAGGSSAPPAAGGSAAVPPPGAPAGMPAASGPGAMPSIGRPAAPPTAGGAAAAPSAGARPAGRSPLRVASTATRAISIQPPLLPEEIASLSGQAPPAAPGSSTAATPIPLPPTGTAAAGAAAEMAPAALERRRNEIMQAYLSYRRLDAFDLLGTDEDASPAAIETRYLELAQRFAPWTMRQPGIADMEEKVRDLFLAGARAYVELLDLERRNVLLFRRRAAREEREKRQPAGDAMAIKTDLLDPEVQYRKGQALMEAGKFQEAAVLLEFASDCDPANGLYSAELAYCRFCISPGQGTRALKELQDTLRRDPRCGLAVYYSGEIHRQLGRRDEAETMLRRAIKMMAPDRRPIDALKLLSSEKHK